MTPITKIGSLPSQFGLICPFFLNQIFEFKIVDPFSFSFYIYYWVWRYTYLALANVDEGKAGRVAAWNIVRCGHTLDNI